LSLSVLDTTTTELPGIYANPLPKTSVSTPPAHNPLPPPTGVDVQRSDVIEENISPEGPVSPFTPVEPVEPVEPVTPLGPTGPVGPVEFPLHDILENIL
jgi:hypothetical protein